MKIKFAKFYQGVSVAKSIRMHVSPDNNGVQSIELIPNIGVMVKAIIRTEKADIPETTVIPFANVAYCTAEEEPKKAK